MVKMEKTKIKYIGSFMPKGIYEVPKKQAQGLLETGDYELPGKKIETIKNKTFIKG